MTAETVIDVGTFYRGERPLATVVQLTQADGTTPVDDLTGFTPKMTFRKVDSGSATTETAVSVSLSDATNAKVQIAWTTSITEISDHFMDQAAGIYEIVVWAGDGTNRYASRRLRVTILEPPGGTVPSI